MVAQGKVGNSISLPLVASLIRIRKVAATIITAKADAIRLRSGLVAVWPRDKVPSFSLMQDFHHICFSDFFPAGTAAGIIGIEHQANIHAGTCALFSALAATAVRDPEPAVRMDKLLCHVMGTNIVHRQVILAHDHLTAIKMWFGGSGNLRKRFFYRA
jgi:hypothetical protein